MSRFIPNATCRTRPLAALAAAGALAAAALLASPTTAAAAQPGVAAPQRLLYYSYRDLATEKGTRALYRRIVSAARNVCPTYDWGLDAFAQSEECQRQAVARAIRQIGNPHLAAVHARELRLHG